MTVSRVLLSKGVKLDWLTPKSLYDKLDEEFHFKLDAATCTHNPMKTPEAYTSKGLEWDWKDPTYCNPPYGRTNITQWLKKARSEQGKGVTSVFLLPSRTGTIWFHEYIYRQPNIEVNFVRGRLLFDVCKLCYPDYKGEKNTAPFDSMIVIFHKRKPITITW